jgi:hypothetical protein
VPRGMLYDMHDPRKAEEKRVLKISGFGCAEACLVGPCSQLVDLPTL